MHLSSLTLVNFRNYHQREFEFHQDLTVIVGQNARGKTNILEAIYLLASGESFRAKKIEEMIGWQQEISHVGGITDNETKLQVTLTRGEVQGKRVQKRGYKVNGVPRRKIDFAGKLKAVTFKPEDLELITGSPSGRRHYLDEVIGQIDRDYRRALDSYEKGLVRRNKLLYLIREGLAERRTLAFWDQLLIKEGNILTIKRRDLMDYINTQTIFPKQLGISYSPSLISQNRLQQYQAEEVAAGHTLVGPHKDDFEIKDKTRNIATYGSRGEQRMAVLWLKLTERQFIEERSGEKPLLLLDDIFSELDKEHDQMVMELLGKQQTIITTTEIEGQFREKEIEMIQLEDRVQ